MRILCASDTSEGGRYAAYFAERVARRTDGPLTFAPRAGLAAAVREQGADLVVVPASTRGMFAARRDARRLERLIRTIDVPVLVLSPLALLPASGVVVAGFEAHDDIERIARTGAWLAERLGGRLTAVHLVRDRPRGIPPTGHEVYDAARRAANAVEDAAGPDLPFELHEERGAPARVLADVAAYADADLIVVGGERGRRRRARQVSTSPLLRRGRHAIVMVPPGATSPARALAHARSTAASRP